MPLEDGVEVISVNSLAFKRFLDIAKLLKTQVHIITDNDGDITTVAKKYKDYEGLSNISISFDNEEAMRTLELQLIKSNGRGRLNEILGKNHDDDQSLIDYILNKKDDVELKILNIDI